MARLIAALLPGNKACYAAAMLHINDLTYRIEGRILFEQATLFLPAKTKMGLVGRNGTGKSTLLRLIRGETHAESGDIRIQPGMRMGSVEQEAPRRAGFDT